MGSSQSIVRNVGKKVVTSQQMGLIAVIVLLTTVVAIVAGNETRPVRTQQADGTWLKVDQTHNRLLNADVLVNYAKDTSFIAIMAIGATAVIISLGIDLSVGSIYALAGVVGAMVLRHYGPVSGTSGGMAVLGALAGVAVSLAVAVACGLINGVAVVGLRVHPFIITLGTMLIFRGIAFVSTKGISIGEFPVPLTEVIKSDLGLGVGLQPVPLLVMLAMAALGTVYLWATVAGRHVYAVGGNIEAARFSGLPTGRILISVYALAGLCAGVSTVLANGIYGAAACNRGEGYELNVIAASVVGGASLTGGRGTAIGAVLGAMLIQLIEQSIITLGIDQNYNRIVIGLAIVLAVVIDQVSTRMTASRLAMAARQDRGETHVAIQPSQGD